VKLPTSLTTVTKFSKILALLLFVTLPFFWFYFGFLLGIEQGKNESVNYPAINNLYSSEQLRDTYTYSGYNYAEVWRSSMNAPIRNSTGYAGVVRRTAGATEWQEYIKIISEPDQAKNNPYKLWVGDGLYLLLVDQFGAGSGEGTAKLIKVTPENDTYDQVKCFYYVPETHGDLGPERFLALEDSSSNNCNNYTLEFR